MKKAFTLIEVILYIGIVSSILFAITAFHSTVLDVNKKSVISQRVESEAQRIDALLKFYFTNGNSVVTPSQNAQSNSITFTTTAVTNNPVTIRLTSNYIEIQETLAGTFNRLSSSEVSVADLNFRNLSYGLTANQTIAYNFTLSSGTGRYFYSKVFNGTITFNR